MSKPKTTREKLIDLGLCLFIVAGYSFLYWWSARP